MEKKENNITRSGDDKNQQVHQYSKLFNLLFCDNFSKSMEIRALKVSASITDEVYREKIKATESVRARMMKLTYAFDPRAVALLLNLCLKTMDYEGCSRYRSHLFSLFRSTDRFIYWQYNVYENFHVLVDLAAKELKNIKAYNSETLPLLEVENFNAVKLQELSNHYSSFYKGIRSLNMQVSILIYNLKLRERDLDSLVDMFSTSVEGELRQYEKQLEITMFKLYQLAKAKVRTGFLPASWKGKILSLQLKIALFGSIGYHTIT